MTAAPEVAPPVKTPPDMFTTPGALLLQVPPGVASVTVAVSPGHTFIEPVIIAGNASTVTTAVEIQVVGSVYVMTAVPGASPVTTSPDTEAMVNGRLLL